jgi:hypothetical protein
MTNIVATLGQLVTRAKKEGLRPQQDVHGNKYWSLNADGAQLRIGRLKEGTTHEVTKLREIVEAAQLQGIKPRQEGKEKYYSLVVENGKVRIETATDDDMKKARAITPRRGA